MDPVVALIGRPNVGKSTLFNALTRSRRALVADEPGLTRDRQYASGHVAGRPVTLIDTGGLSGEQVELDERMAEQTAAAIAEADAVVVIVDGRSGLTATDEAVLERLRRADKPFHIAVNKVDGVDADAALAEFYGLGPAPPLAISAARRRGLRQLSERIAELLPPAPERTDGAATGGADEPIRVTVVGRPNVGKSTLINRLIGAPRLLAYDQPGTTRDAVEVPFSFKGQSFTLVDTAGLRRRGRVSGTIEKFSAVKTLEAIRSAHVVIVVLDARDGVVEQDQHLVGHALDAGRGVVLAVNKWDGLERAAKERVRSEHERRFEFVDFVESRYISALHGTGVGRLLNAAVTAHAAGGRELPTAELTRVLTDAVAEHAPPTAGGGRIKLRYAHQGGSYPPRVIIHGSRVDRLPGSYKRYLARMFRKAFDLYGTPLELEFRAGHNPYAGRKRQNRSTSAKRS